MPPGNCPYNVSKAALKCYTEALEHELRTTPENKLRSALLVPGWVNTSIQRKYIRDYQSPDVKSEVPFSEDKPATGAWMPAQVIDFMIAELDKHRFYIICPDNDVDRTTDNARMTWTMQDITQDRVPLSRWHPEYTESFATFLAQEKQKGNN
jgi:short-subunit dehydrogenase